MPRAAEDAHLQLGVVDAQRTAADLEAVHDQVVAVRQRRSRIASRAVRRARRTGSVNGWWFASQRSSSASHLNSGKSTTHSVVEAVALDAELVGHLEAQHAEDLVRDIVRVGDHADAGRRARRPARRAERAISASVKNFAIGERTSPSVGERDPRETLGARVERDLVERVDLAAAPVAGALRVDALDARRRRPAHPRTP